MPSHRRARDRRPARIHGRTAPRWFTAATTPPATIRLPPQTTNAIVDRSSGVSDSLTMAAGASLLVGRRAVEAALASIWGAGGADGLRCVLLHASGRELDSRQAAAVRSEAVTAAGVARRRPSDRRFPGRAGRRRARGRARAPRRQPARAGAGRRPGRAGRRRSRQPTGSLVGADGVADVAHRLDGAHARDDVEVVRRRR